MVAGPRAEGIDDVEIPIREVTAGPITPPLQPGPRRRRLTPGVLAGQQPAGQGKVGKVGHTQAQAQGDDLRFVGPVSRL